MSTEALTPAVEAAALIRRAQSMGDFGAILRRGDPDRGSLMLVLSNRGNHVACLERVLTASGAYRWQRSGPPESAGSAEVAQFLARRARSDGDLWQIELDIASAEQFIAETTSAG